METIEFEHLNYANVKERKFSVSPVFVTVLDSFVGHFDGKEHWTIREEKRFISYDGTVKEIIENRTVEKSDYMERIESDKKYIADLREREYTEVK